MTERRRVGAVGRRDLRDLAGGNLPVRRGGRRPSGRDRLYLCAQRRVRANLTPVYALTDADSVDEKGDKDPVQVERAQPWSLPTIQRVECLSRANEYATIPVEARDQSQIELYGVRVGTTIQAHEICDEINVGPIVAQTILQRQLYVRARYTFKLSWEYCLLDPMDVVTINDANLGLSVCPVRIIAIEEDEKGLIAVTAEELTAGVSTRSSTPSLRRPEASSTAASPPRPSTRR